VSRGVRESGEGRVWRDGSGARRDERVRDGKGGDTRKRGRTQRMRESRGRGRKVVERGERRGGGWRRRRIGEGA